MASSTQSRRSNPKTNTRARNGATRKGPGKSTSVQRALEMIESGRATQQDALEVFDALPAVELDFMWGQWKGSGVNTDHPMDGLLENYRWYGKEFIDEDHVHPLLFQTGGGRLFKVNPALMPMGLALTQQWLKKPFMRFLFQTFRFLISTKKTTARLRITRLRGKDSATMCYDALAIHDVFRKVDNDTVLGYMDFKGMDLPFFFALRRV